MKKIIIVIVFLIVIAITAGLVYQFVLKKDSNNENEPLENQTTIDPNAILFEDIYDGENTDMILENDLDVVNGYFTITPNGIDTFLRVRVTSKSSEIKSYSIEMAAVNKETNEVIMTDTLETDNLNPEEVKEIDIFTNVDEEMAQKLRSAQYKVVKIIPK